MIPTFVTLLLAKATVVVVVAFVLSCAMRRASAGARYLVWLAALVALLGIPALAAWAPLRVAILPAVPTGRALERLSMVAGPSAEGRALATSSPAALASAGGESNAAQGAVSARARRPTQPSSAAPRRIDLVPTLFALWAAVALAITGSLARAWLAVRRIVRRARPLDTPEWVALLYEASDRLGLREPPRLLRSGHSKVPFACGLARPTIVLPTESDAWTSGCRRAVVLHELAHVRRRDLIGHTLARVVCAVYWFHPLVWVAARRLRGESERACDDLALSCGERAPDYAEHLLDVLTTIRNHSTPIAAVAMARRDDFEGRLVDILDSDRPRTAPGRRQAAALVGALTLVGALVGAVAPTRAAPVTDAPALREPPRAAVLRLPRDTGPAPTARAPALPQRAADGAAREDRSVRAASDVASAAVAPAVPQQPLGGEWTVRIAGPSEGPSERRGDGPIVHVALWAPGLNTFYIPLARMEGLSAEQITSSSGPAVRFRLRHEAGTFTFEGSFRGGRGQGRFEFTPDPAFADGFVRRGMRRPTPEQQLSMARHDVTLALVDELIAQGYAGPVTEDIVQIGMTSIDLRFLRDMSALGYRLRTVQELIRLYNNGVDPGFIRELTSVGYAGLPPDDLLKLSNHSLNATRIREQNERAGRRLSVDELVDARVHGRTVSSRPTSTPLDGRWVIAGARGGYTDVELFWSDNTNWRRWFPSSELRGLSASDAVATISVPVSFRIEQDAGTFEFEGTFRGGRGSGDFRFRPKREFVSTLRSLGVEGVAELSDHDLKNLAYGLMSSAAVSEFKALYAPLTFRNVVHLAIYRVTPEYARALQSLGVTDARTVAGVIDLRIYRLTPEYVREMDAVGYRGLSGRLLVEMRQAGVTAAFIRSVREEGRGELSPETLIELARERRGHRRYRP